MEIANALIKDIVSKWEIPCDIELTKDTPDGVLIGGKTINLGNVPEPIKISIHSLLTISNKINVVLDSIYCKINNHQQSYLKSFVKIKIADDIGKIVNMTALFEKRLDILFTLLKIY
jgi:hypothetical protein